MNDNEFMVKDKIFYKQFFLMCAVLILQNVITLSVNLADNIMLGAYSETALSGVAAVNQIQFFYQQVLSALGEGIVILGSQYFGKGDVNPVKQISAGGMRIALGLCIILFIVMSAFPAQVLGLFTTDTSIISEGCAYVRVIRFTYLFFAVTQILLATLRSTGIVRISLVLSLTTLVINCCINYVLIYGRFGAPEMGVTGAAAGTLTARIAELIILLIYILKKQKLLPLHFADYLHLNRTLFFDYIRVTWPMTIVQGLWGINIALQTAILGHMTARAIAANSAASTLYVIAKAMPIGACGTAAFFIGKTVGEGDPVKVRQYAKTMQVLFVLIGIVSGVLLFFIRIPVLSLYKLEAETMRMADSFLILLSFVAVTMSYQMPTNNGIIRGGGDTKFTMKLDLISIWLIVLPLSFIMAFVVKASPLVVVACLNADQVFKCVPAFIKANYGHWAKKLTR